MLMEISLLFFCMTHCNIFFLSSADSNVGFSHMIHRQNTFIQTSYMNSNDSARQAVFLTMFPYICRKN